MSQSLRVEGIHSTKFVSENGVNSSHRQSLVWESKLAPWKWMNSYGIYERQSQKLDHLDPTSEGGRLANGWLV